MKEAGWGAGRGAVKRVARPAGPAPDAARLREAALAHLARFEASEAGLRRVLDRAVSRWGRRAGAVPGAEPDRIAAEAARARALIDAVVRGTVSQGIVDDRRYAERRASLDQRHGRSARASRAALEAKGVPAELASEATRRSVEEEMAAALALLRRRRLGPFAPSGAAPADAAPDGGARRRVLGTLARSGFAGDVARRALALDREAAETLLSARDREE